jgi:hypothetical protein
MRTAALLQWLNIKLHAPVAALLLCSSGTRRGWVELSKLCHMGQDGGPAAGLGEAF